MAGDVDILEAVALESSGARELEATPDSPARVIHRYGELSVLAVPDGETPSGVVRAAELAETTDGLGEVERLGLSALRLRESEEFRAAKRNRPRNREEWDMPGCTTVVPPPEPAEGLARAGPTSSYLEGTVAVGIVVVQGPTAALQFTDAEFTKVIAEVQNGLSWYATTNPVVGISFSYDIQNVGLALPADPNAPDLEAYWRDPAMGAIGFSADWNGVTAYIEDLRNRFGTCWTYCVFFTKYPLGWFAYASIGGDGSSWTMPRTAGAPTTSTACSPTRRDTSSAARTNTPTAGATAEGAGADSGSSTVTARTAPRAAACCAS